MRPAVPPPASRRHLFLYAGITILLSTLWIWPHAARLRQVPDRGDPVFSAWRLATLSHQLQNDPRHLFDGNIFYPRSHTLAYSDATLLEGFAGTPFILAGVDPLLVSNALFLIAFPLCGLAFAYAGWRLTGNLLAGLVTGALGAWYPFHAEHYSHLELQWFMFVPIALVSVLDTIADPTWRRGIWLGTVLGLQCLASMYFGVMLVTVLVPFAAVALIRRRGSLSLRRLASAVAAIAAVLLPVGALLMIPYHQASASHGERSLDEVLEGSADPSDYLKTPKRLTTYSWHSRQFNRPERELYPGTATLALAALGILALPAEPVLPLVVAGVAAFDWSLGMHGLTYRPLRALVLPYKSIRVPARFSVFVGTALILLAGYGANRLIGNGSRRRQLVVTIGLLAVIALDLRTTIDLVDYYPRIPSFYDRVTSSSVLAELPVGHEIDYMYFSTRHWGRLLGGYSGFIPIDPPLAASLMAFPAAESIEGLRARGATHLTYNCAFERSPERCRHNLAELAQRRDLELLATETWQGASAQLYRFR